MWNALIGAGISALGGIMNGIAGANAARQKKLLLDTQEKEALDSYHDSLGDANQSASAQLADTRLRKNYQEALRQMGGATSNMTNAERAAALETMNEGLAEQQAEIAVAGEAARRQAKSDYRTEKKAINAQRMEMESQKQAQMAKATGQVVGAGLNIVQGAVGDALSKPSGDNGGTEQVGTEVQGVTDVGSGNGMYAGVQTKDNALKTLQTKVGAKPAVATPTDNASWWDEEQKKNNFFGVNNK